MSEKPTRSNGAKGANGASRGGFVSKRFSNIPPSLDIMVGDQEDEAVEVDLSNLVDDPSELCQLLDAENAAREYWMTIGLAYAKLNKKDCAIEMLVRGSGAIGTSSAQKDREKLPLVTALCWLYLSKSREAPRVAPDNGPAEAKTKEYFLQQATSTLNEAMRTHSSYPPLHLARGVLLLLRASLKVPSKANTKSMGAVDAEKTDLLKQALKSFGEAIRASGGKNMLAMMGKARALYALGIFAEALTAYQEVLTKMPEMVDPDPRIGIGCCFWQLGFKEDAKIAWERCLEINKDSKIPNILLGLYYLSASSQVPTQSPEFITLYKKGMTEFIQKGFKLDKDYPLTCATFASFFLSRRQLEHVGSLAHKAIQYTDVNAIASDGWYLLARKEHLEGELSSASDYYRRADDARGGDERGYLPAKLGTVQLLIAKNELGEAKLQLEKMIQHSKNYEPMILLGTMYAEEAFASMSAPVKEDKSSEAKKAIALLENVRSAWRDPKKNVTPDAAVLLNLARLYEAENPEKALQCLQQVERLELDQVPQSQRPADTDDENAILSATRKFLPPQLLNNIGCFHSQAENHEQASEMFEAALSACMRVDQGEEDIDTDALVTTISFNLGRSYEYRGMVDQAVKVYEGLLERHDDYIDAGARLAYIKLRKNPNKEGPDAVAKLYHEQSSDLEVRALYGWYLGRVNSKKRPANINEDVELRHYKHTLQNHDKHDRYALVGMGNLYLVHAREMRRDTDQDKQKRSAVYARAVEFFDKALQLDPKNAYAAQGIAIALAEDKKDIRTALQIFNKIRETVKDAHVFINLGHTYAELRQWSKAVESYEIALSKEGKENDAGILSCLGRTWLNRGRQERNLDACVKALGYARRAFAEAPDQLHFKFNVAFVQIQVATVIHALSETQRNSAQLEDAAEGLEAAIEALDEIASSPQTPYPKHDIEQRANMARNTQRRQLERALASQKEYEGKNKEKLAAALEHRQAELRRREAERKKAEEDEQKRQERIRKEREIIAAQDRQLADKRADEERARQDADMTTDAETGEKVKRKRKQASARAREGSGEPRKSRSGRSRQRKKRADDEEDDEGEADDGEAGEEHRPPKKKQRLSSRKDTSKFLSAEIVVESDDSGDELERAERALARNGTPASFGDDASAKDDGHMEVDGGVQEARDTADDDEEEDETVARPTRTTRRGRIIDDDEDGEDQEVSAAAGHGGDDADERSGGEKVSDTADISMADEDDE